MAHKTLSDVTAGPVPANTDKVWQRIEKALRLASPQGLTPTLEAAHSAVLLHLEMVRVDRGSPEAPHTAIRGYYCGGRSRKRVLNLPDDLMRCGLPETAALAQEARDLFDCADDDLDRWISWYALDEGASDNTIWTKVEVLSRKAATYDYGAAAWRLVQSAPEEAARVPVEPARRGILSRLFGGG